MDANSNQGKDLDIEVPDIGDIAIDIGDKPKDFSEPKKETPVGSGSKKDSKPVEDSKSEEEKEES